MDEQTNEIFFLVLGIVMFVMAVTLLLEYERSFFQGYSDLYHASENEYVMPEGR